MPPGQGTGVTIGVNVNSGQAQRGLSGVGSAVTKLANTAKNVFGPGGGQQVQNYTRHLVNLERQYDRITQRIKTLQGAQQQLIAQERQLYGSKAPGAEAQYKLTQRALAQNERSLSFWQAKALGAQSQLTYAQGNRTALGGGGGNLLGALFSGGGAGGVGAAIGGMLGGGVGAAAGMALGKLVQSGIKLATKPFMTALDEQKILADLMPRMRLDAPGLGFSPKGYMNELRGMSMPLGYSGIEGAQIETAMAPGSNGLGRNLHNDSQAAMMMARMFGIDAGGQSSMLAEAGKMGAFVPGQARQFAQMLAREIGISGLGPRATEVQEATLTLMHRQLATSATTQGTTAAVAQTILAKTGLPGFQGTEGAGVLAGFQGAMTGASDDATLAFQVAAMRRMRHAPQGYYAMRDVQSQGPLGNNDYFSALMQQARMMPNAGASVDIFSRVSGIPFHKAKQMFEHTHGFADFNLGNMDAMRKRFKLGSEYDVGKGAKKAMDAPGNQIREFGATLTGLMGKAGTDMVIGVGKTAHETALAAQYLMNIDKNIARIAGPTERLTPGKWATVPDGKGGFKQGTMDKAANAIVHPFVKAWDWFTDQGEFSKENRRKKGGGPPALPPVTGPPTQRSSLDGHDMHLHVHFDHSAHTIHPQVKLAFMGMIEESLDEISRRRTRGNLHHRYERVG